MRDSDDADNQVMKVGQHAHGKGCINPYEWDETRQVGRNPAPPRAPQFPKQQGESGPGAGRLGNGHCFKNGGEHFTAI